MTFFKIYLVARNQQSMNKKRLKQHNPKGKFIPLIGLPNIGNETGRTK